MSLFSLAEQRSQISKSCTLTNGMLFLEQDTSVCLLYGKVYICFHFCHSAAFFWLYAKDIRSSSFIWTVTVVAIVPRLFVSVVEFENDLSHWPVVLFMFIQLSHFQQSDTYNKKLCVGLHLVWWATTSLFSLSVCVNMGRERVGVRYQCYMALIELTINQMIIITPTITAYRAIEFPNSISALFIFWPCSVCMSNDDSGCMIDTTVFMHNLVLISSPKTVIVVIKKAFLTEFDISNKSFGYLIYWMEKFISMSF